MNSGPFSESPPPSPRVVARYDYVDEGGALLFQVRRWQPGRNGGIKDFTQHKWDGAKFLPRLGDARMVLYNLPEVVEQVAAGAIVYVVEGEKDVECLRACGVAATCNPGGAGKWRPEFSETLRGAHVVVIHDNDSDAQGRSGQQHAKAVHDSLKPFGEIVKTCGSGSSVDYAAAS